MLGLEKQRTQFDIVISDVLRCHYDWDDFYNYLNKGGFLWYLAHHDKDVNELGETKLHHVHLVLVCPHVMRCKKIINDLADCLYTNVQNIQVQEVINLFGAIQYLIHKNNPEKFQYDPSVIQTNDSIENLKGILDENIKKATTISTLRLKSLILDDNLNVNDLIDAIGIGAYQHYRPTIHDIYEIRYGRDRARQQKFKDNPNIVDEH